MLWRSQRRMLCQWWRNDAAVALVAGDPIELDQPLQVVQALPARPGRAEELDAGQAGAEVVACLLPVLLDLAHHASDSVARPVVR